MATVTKSLGVIGPAELQIDYDDALLRLLAVRCINGGDQPASLTGFSVARPNRTFAFTFPAGQTTTQNVPQGANNRFDITVDARGRVDGVEWSFAYPAVTV